MRPHGSRDRAPIPSEPDPARGSPALGAGGVWVAAAAAAAGVGSAYWDDSWHTTLGRDSTFIPPHLLLYASILTVGVVIAGWGWRRLAATRSVAAVFRTPGFALAVAAAVATAAAAPADAFWHTAFGRDAVLWSPPHLLSVIGTLCVLIGLLTGTDRHVPAPPRIALAAGVLGAALIIVMEYDTDVPQFTETLYLPLLLATTLGAAWVITTLVPGRTRLVLVVAVYLVFRVVLWVLLTTSGWLAPDLPVAVAGGRPRRDHPATAGLRDRDQQRPTHPRRLVRRRHHHGDHRQHDRPHRAAGDSPPIRRRGRGPHPSAGRPRPAPTRAGARPRPGHRLRHRTDDRHRRRHRAADRHHHRHPPHRRHRPHPVPSGRPPHRRGPHRAAARTTRHPASRYLHRGTGTAVTGAVVRVRPVRHRRTHPRGVGARRSATHRPAEPAAQPLPARHRPHPVTGGRSSSAPCSSPSRRHSRSPRPSPSPAADASSPPATT